MPRKRKPWAAVVAVGGTVVVALAATIVWSSARPAPAPAPSVAPASTEQRPAAPPSVRFDADEAFDRAKAEALRWSPEALLVRIEAGPFVEGKLNDEGTVRAEFGKPAGAHVGPGAGLHREQLVITVSKSGLASVSRNAAGGVGVADPNCIFQDVWRKALPALPNAQTPLSLRYELSSGNRAIWKVVGDAAAAPLRLIDGSNCTFLVR